MAPPGVRRPGPRRPEGAPTGPNDVREAILAAAATLFAHRGIDAVSLRDIAAKADVNLALIRRYVGDRDLVIAATFAYVSEQLTAAVQDEPLAAQGYDADTVMGQWVRIAAAMVISGRPMPTGLDPRSTGRGPRSTGLDNPVLAMADTLSAAYGISEEAARLRAAQIVAAALGWRIFEQYLIEAADLGMIPLDTLREELTRSARRLGATPWPSPADPPTFTD